MLVEDWLEGQVVKVLRHIVRHLIATRVKTLREVAVAVKEPDSCQSHIAIARLLDIVTREDA